MFIFSFFTGSIIRMIFGLFTGIILLAVVFVVVVGALAATGGPGACSPGGGPVTVDTANSDAFQTKWDAFNDVLKAGSPSSVTLSESELSSRAKTYLDKHDVGFHDPRVCLHNGYGEASSTFSLLGVDVKLKIKGTLDLAGAHPKGHIDSMQIGNVPGFLTSPAEKVVNRALDSALNDLKLDHRYAPVLTDGKATVGGTP